MTLDRSYFIDALHYRLFSWFERDPVRRRGWQAPAEGAVGIATDIGPEREENQDRAAVASFSSTDGAAYVLAMVCDGMGGMAHGGQCASLAISAFIVGFLKIQTAVLDHRLRRAAEQANAVVHRRFGGKGGSTLSALCFTAAGCLGMNVGDSRIYSRSGGRLHLLTKDDTLAAHRQGEQGDPGSRSLLQYIGIGPDLVAHVIKIPSECEVALVASDGAHSMPIDALQSLTRHAHSASELTRRVVQTAQWMGSRDNGTAVCVEVSATARLPQLERAVWLLDPGGEYPILATRLFHDVVRGVAASHSQGVLRRDLKPSNIMVSGGLRIERAKVTDFGIAKMTEDEFVGAAEGGQATITTSKTVVGALPYMAPEAIETPRHVKLAADIWSLGAMGYELLLGRKPYGSGLIAVRNITAGQPPNYQVPDRGRQFEPAFNQLRELIACCLQHDSALRPSASELAGACADLCYSADPRFVGTVSDIRYRSWGFIQQDAGPQVFFHLNSVYGRRPKVGERVLFSKYPGGGADRAFPVIKMRS